MNGAAQTDLNGAVDLGPRATYTLTKTCHDVVELTYQEPTGRNVQVSFILDRITSVDYQAEAGSATLQVFSTHGRVLFLSAGPFVGSLALEDVKDAYHEVLGYLDWR